VAAAPGMAPTRPKVTDMALDFWYERAMRGIAGLDEEAAELRRDTEQVLFAPPAEPPDEEDE
jgi:hypothetical protein